MANQFTTRKTNPNCAICDKSNLPSICAVCVNFRLNAYGSNLKALKNRRDALYKRLSEVLLAKSEADDQKSWILAQNEKLARMREKLQYRQEQLLQGKAKIERTSRDLKVKYGLLESAMAVLKKNQAEQLEKSCPNLVHTLALGYTSITKKLLLNQSAVVKQICKLFPLCPVKSDGERKDGFTGRCYTICDARLPRGLDPHSVPSEELAASLGYMVQLLNLVVHTVFAPALHNSGFAGSCSRIWQRDSYWDARPSSRSSEYPLFIPRQKVCAGGGEASWSDRSSSNFGVASMESDRKAHLDTPSRNSFNFSSASPHSIEIHKDLQKGILLLKKSVACINAYCYNLLCLDVPTEAPTFEAFAELLATISSFKEDQSIGSLKMASSRSQKQAQQLKKSLWEVDSATASSTLLESTYAPFGEKNVFTHNPPSSAASLVCTVELSDAGKKENLIEGWDLVEHPKYPPPPSQTEDVEHWTRAMFIDATKK